MSSVHNAGGPRLIESSARGGCRLLCTPHLAPRVVLSPSSHGGFVMCTVLCTLTQPLHELLKRDCLESSRRVLDRLCLVLQEGEMGHSRPVLATRYTPDRGLLGLSRQTLRVYPRTSP